MNDIIWEGAGEGETTALGGEGGASAIWVANGFRVNFMLGLA
jgi:hypothetical protein